MRRVVVAVALVFAFATGVAADKIRTYFTVTLTDVTQVCFDRSASAPNGWLVSALATIRASDNVTYQTRISANASAGQKTTVENFIATNVLGPLNTQEGL